MSKYKLSEEVAQEQLDLFLDYYDVNVESIEDEGLKSAFSLKLGSLKKAIRSGRLEINNEDDLLIRQNFQCKYEGMSEENAYVEYRVITGQDKIEVDKDKSPGMHSNMYRLLGSLSSNNESLFRKLKGPDLSTAEALAQIFFLS